MLKEILYKIKDFFLEPIDEVKFELSNYEFEKFLKEKSPEATAYHSNLIKQMSLKYCAILGDNCKTTKCIHFYEGKIKFKNGNKVLKINANWYLTKPYCRLWKK